MGESSQTGSTWATLPEPGVMVIHFVSGSGRDQFEAKTIVWSIKNVAGFLEMSNEEREENGITFEAGTWFYVSGRGYATWKFYFEIDKDSEQDKDMIVGVFGHFDDSVVESATASYSVSLSSGGNLITKYKKDRNDFAFNGWDYEKLMPKSELLEKTKATNSLEVTLRLKALADICFEPVLQAPSSQHQHKLGRGQSANMGGNWATSPGLGDLHFVSGSGSGRDEFEAKTIAWSIKNVLGFLEMTNDEMDENAITFEAGTFHLNDGTRCEGTWKFFIENDKNKDMMMALFGPEFDNASNLKSALASYSVSLSSGGNLITKYEKDRRDFGLDYWDHEKLGMSKSELLEKTRGTNKLEVTLRLKALADICFKPVLQEPSSQSQDRHQLLRGQATSDFRKLLESGDGADLEIRVPKEAGGEVDEASYYTKEVHKAILMARSPVFSKMFAKGSKMVEAQTGQVVIKDLSPKGLDIFLHFLYTGEVLSDWAQVLPELLNAAEKYDCGKLKQYLGHNLLTVVTTTNALKMLKLAKLHKLSFAAKGVMEFIQRNMNAVFTQDVIEEYCYK